MTTEITARDKLLLYVVGMLAFIFFFVQFMLTPALEASDEAAASLAEAQQAQIAMQETIALAGTNAAAKTESWAALQGPVSLDISAIDTQTLTGYAASTQADDTAAPTDINSADPMLATADTNTVLMELAPPLTRIYAQADYFKQCTVTFRCTGSDSNFYTMLDDLAAQYPSVQLKSVQIDHAAYTNASGATTNTATYTVQLNVILCDKESVVS